MKRLLLLFLGSLLWTVSEAVPVSEPQARAKALRFFQRHGQTRLTGPTLQLEWDGESATTRSDNAPAYYVYNRTDAPGFVIVAGDDLVATILGYSDEHSFQSKDMPTNLSGWMEHLRQDILATRRQGFATTRSGNEEVGDVVMKLETALWNQSAPYNNDCPLINGKRAVTGCVATAFAIAMRYHRWPDQGEGTIPSYISQGSTSVTIAERPLGEPYNWDLMPLKYDANSSADEQAQVARLMADLGAASQAVYGASTSAFTEYMVQACIKYMKYDAAVQLHRRTYFSDSEWIAMLKKELHNCGPILYGGQAPDGGHQFIMDGYTTNDYFSLNWGWGGLANGYYVVDNLTPTAQGVGGSDSSQGFNYDQDAIFGFKKAEAGSQPQVNIYLQDITGISGYPDLTGLSSKEKQITQGKEFKMDMGYINNIGFTDFPGYVRLSLFDGNGNFKEQVCQEIHSYASAPLPSGYVAWRTDWKCLIEGAIGRKDYIAVEYCVDDKKEWQPMRYAKTAVGHYYIYQNAGSIQSETSLSFDRTTRVLTVSTAENVTWQLLLQENESAVASGSTSTGSTTFRIETKDLAKGNYTLSLSHEGEIYMLDIKL